MKYHLYDENYTFIKVLLINTRNKKLFYVKESMIMMIDHIWMIHLIT